jgi:hypothetical protein
MKIKEYNDMKAYLLKPNRLFTSKPQDTIGGGAIQGEDLGSRTGFGSPEAIEYLKNLKPGSVVNTYAIGKQFGIAPATVRGQVERNFPQLTLQTREESAAIAKETRREQYRQKKSDVPVPETGVRGKGAESRTKGRDVTNVRWPSEEMKNEYLGNLKDRYSDVKGRKGLTNKELAIKFFGEDTKANVGQIEKINRYYIEDLKLDFKPAPKSEVTEKRKRRLSITQGGKTFKGTDKVPFHHIMNIGGEVDLTTKDVAFINKEMNSKLAPYNTKLNDIADAISNQLNNQEPGYLKRIDELNNQAEEIIQSVKTRLPKKYQGYIGFNRLDPILDENGTAIRLNVTRVGVDDSKSIAGKTGETIKLKDLTQKGIEEYGKNRKQVKEYLYDRFCVKGKAQGGRIGFANGPCTADDVAKGMRQAIQSGDTAAVTNALKVSKNLLGKVVAPADIAIETAFALPYLLEGDLEGAKAATTAGLFGWGKDLQEQVGDRFGTNSPAYGSLEKQRAIDLQVEGMFEMDKALAYGEKSGVFTKDKDGNYTKNPNLSVSQIDSFKNANNIFKSGAEKTMEAKNLFIDALPKIEGLENESTATSQLGVFSDELRSGVLDQKIGDPGIIANLTKSLNVSQPADTSKVKPFIETMGGETKFPIPSRVAEGSDLIKERIDQLREMRIGDYPPDVALGIPSYEKEQAYEGIRPYALKYGPKAAKEFFEAQGIDTEPYLKGMAPILYMKQGGRIQLANGGRLSFAEGPEDPKKRTTLKKIGIGGGIAGGLATGLINILDLFKGGAKTGVMATKAAESEAQKLFFDLVNAVKNKGILKKLDQMTDFSRGGAYYEYKGVKVLEDGENIELQFTTDKGAPAVVEYRKPGYDVDPEAGTSYKVPGEFTNEGQEVYKMGGDNYYKDFEDEIIDPIDEVKKIIDD